MKYNNVIQWDQLEVASWLDTRGYKTDLHVTGDILLQLSEKQIKPLVNNGIVRKRLCRDLKNLKNSLDYSNSEAEQTAQVLASTSPDLVEHTHRLLSSGLCLENIDQIDNISLRLAEVGIENSLHLGKIQAIFEREKNKQKGKVHIAHDSRSQIFGSLVDIYLKLRGFQTSGSRECGSIHDADILVVVLTNTDSLQTVEEEIQEALHNGLPVVLVVEERLDLDDVSWNLEEVKVVRWIHDYQDAVIDRIEKIITSDTVKSMKTRSISVDSGIDEC